MVIESGARIAELGTILGIWAHPDDEAYLSGGLMAMAREAGSRVVCVTATHGELGTTDSVAWPQHRLAAERRIELARCLDILGVAEHHWLDYHDGRCNEVQVSDAVAHLCAVMESVQPDTVLTFGSDGITGHSDHQAVSAWTVEAFDIVAPVGARLLCAAVHDQRESRWESINESLGVFPPGYPITTPIDELAVHLVLDPEIAARKVRALAAQATQTAALIAAMGLETYTAWVGDESFLQRR